MYDEEIAGAEARWMKPVIDFLTPLYRHRWIPSHDSGHHIRVWKNASVMPDTSIHYDDTFFEQLLLACLFHDAGMLISPTEKHGRHSRRLCEEFLHAHAGNITFGTELLLEAVEFHDDKQYLNKPGNNPVYNMLCLADDMDAFGALGVYRYVEIYLLRGCREDQIPDMILENAAIRYRHMLSYSGRFAWLADRIDEPYQLLMNYLRNDSFPETPLTLIRWLQQNIIEPKADPWSFFNENRVHSGNLRLDSFLTQINKEILNS